MDPHQQQQQQQNMNSGLTRYRSAPSSYFANLMTNSGGYGEDDCDQFLNPRVSSPESDRFFSRFMSSCAGEETNSTNLGGEIGGNSLVNESVVQVQTHFVAPVSMKNEPDVLNAHQQQQQQQQLGYQSQSLLDHKPPVAANSGLENSYNVASTMGMDGLPQMKMSGSGGSNSNLIRHSSSPAGLFANINVENGYAVMRGMGHFGAGGSANAEVSFSTGSRLKNQSDFPPGSPSSSGIMPHSVEIGGKIIGIGSRESGNFGDSPKNGGGYMTAGFSSTSWDDSTLISDNFLKGFTENQSNDGGNQTPSVLAHHLSLPTSSAEMSAMEKLLQFQDSVPLKIRAKRGCATHPRSIAERVRRTRISERMRKLQELVPNMDKQTNTADMLDLAVDYIKDLQKQVKTLSDTRAKCTCSDNEKS